MKLKSQIRSFIPNKFLYYPIYNRHKTFLENFDDFSEDEAHNFQLQKVKTIVKSAKRNVPFYGKLWADLGINTELTSLDDFGRFPIISKKDIIRKQSEFITTKVPSYKVRQLTTGGSSGQALTFFKTKQDAAQETAHIDHILQKMGLNNRIPYKVATLRGDTNASHRVTKIGRHLSLSAFDLTDSNIIDFAKHISQHGIRLLHAYPSALNLMLLTLNRHNIRFDFSLLQAILLSSEKVTSTELHNFHDYFGVPICNLYGNSEHTVLGYEIYPDTKFQFVKSYSLVEFNKSNIISTNFNDPYMPFIRYDTGDQVGIDSNRQLNILGREQDFIITKCMKKISIAAVNVHDNTFSGLSEYQLIQNTPGEVTIIGVVSDAAEFNRDKVISNMTNRIGNGIIIHFESVEKISLTKSGKKKYLQQNLDVTQYD